MVTAPRSESKGWRADVLTVGDLVQQLGQHGRVTDIAGRDLDGSHLKRFFVDTYVYLAPYPALGATVLAGIPLTFALRLDTCAVDEQVQWPGSPAIWQAHVQCSLTAAKGAEIWHCPVQTNKSQQAFHKACGLSERQAKQDLHRQAGLDRGITEAVPPTALAARRRHPDHIRVKPDRQRSSPSQRCIIRRPVPGLVIRRGPTAHVAQLSCWIYTVNPPCDLRNKADQRSYLQTAYKMSLRSTSLYARFRFRQDQRSLAVRKIEKAQGQLVS